MSQQPLRRRDPALHARNVRTALVLFSIALVFFVGVMASKALGYSAGIGFLGLAILVFLAFAIGRNLRHGK